MTTVIYHSADFDGIFCREIARHFLGDKDVNYIGWNYGEPKLHFPKKGSVYILDLSPDCIEYPEPMVNNLLCLIWIDHHKSSIEKWPSTIPGYRIDGVAACRLCWAYFTMSLPPKQAYIDRQVVEPLAVRIAGEYDVWDHRGDGDLEFQFGLRSTPLTDGIWDELLLPKNLPRLTECLIETGRTSMYYAQNQDAIWLKEAGYLLKWEGLTFLALNSVERGSLKFASQDKPETGHDALMLFGWRGKLWTVSMYHAAHRQDIDLSLIAVKHGGGGHRGACGFTCQKLPFL